MGRLQKVNDRKIGLLCSIGRNQYYRMVEPFIGKILLLKKRAFQDNVDVCMMLHPGGVFFHKSKASLTIFMTHYITMHSTQDLQYPFMLATQDLTVEFLGKASHATRKFSFFCLMHMYTFIDCNIHS